MNTIKIFFALSFFFSFASVTQAQQDKLNYDNTVIASVNFDIEQTQTDLTLENQNHTTIQLSGFNATNTTINNISKIFTNTYSFNFNHKQFLKPVYRKSAYC